MGIDRVIIGPTEVSGIGQALVAGFSALNITSVAAFREPHRFQYGGAPEVDRRLVRCWQRCFSRWRVTRGATQRRLWSVAVEALAWCIVATYARRRTVIVYMFAGSFTRFPRIEYTLMKACRARVVFLNLGSDLRPPYMDGPALRAVPDIDALTRLTRQRRRVAELQEQFADVIITAPSCGQFFTKPFLSWFAVGIPQEAPPPTPSRAPTEGRPLRVLHAPSDPEIKGTELVRAAVRSVQASGIKIDYLELHGVPHDQVVESLRATDLLIDQAFSDLPMSGFGAEGAILGVPAITAGYYADQVQATVPALLTPPSVFVHPARLEESIRALASSPAERSTLGAAAKEFILTTWQPKTSAQRILDALNGEADPSWFVDPFSVNYFWGCGAEKSIVKSAIKGMIDRGGVSSLHLVHNPVIERFIFSEVKD